MTNQYKSVKACRPRFVQHYPGSGGIKFGVSGVDFKTIQSPMFCPAWMVPPVQEEKEQPGLNCETRHMYTEFEGHRIKLTYYVLVPNENGFCYVKYIGDKRYAILKRGLLCLVETVQNCRVVACVLILESWSGYRIDSLRAVVAVVEIHWSVWAVSTSSGWCSWF